MNISFPIPWAAEGKMLDVDAARGICDNTSYLCAQEAERLGHTTQIVNILAMSPTREGTIGHKVVVVDGAYILDVPQTELLEWGEGKGWTHVRSIMSNDVAPEFESIKYPLTGEDLSPIWMFSPEDTHVDEKYGWGCEYRMHVIKSVLGLFKNVKKEIPPFNPHEWGPSSASPEELIEQEKIHNKYPVYTGTYNGMQVRYDTNSEDFDYMPKKVLQWTTGVFEPRIIPLTAIDLQKAYSVDGKKLMESIIKQIK